MIWNPACVSVRDSKLINEDNTASNRWLLGYALCKNSTRNISSLSSGKSSWLQMSPTTPWLPEIWDYVEFWCVLSLPAPMHPKTQIRHVPSWTGKIQVPFKRTEKMQNDVGAANLKQLAKKKEQTIVQTHNHLVSGRLRSRDQKLGEGIESFFFFPLSFLLVHSNSLWKLGFHMVNIGSLEH